MASLQPILTIKDSVEIRLRVRRQMKLEIRDKSAAILPKINTHFCYSHAQLAPADRPSTGWIHHNVA
jgi:hypothetical protein